jgi:hypothetical protein
VLNLAGNLLSGMMPDLSSLTQLSELDLTSNGNLTGITALPRQSTESPSPTPQIQVEIGSGKNESNAKLNPATIAIIFASIVILSVCALVAYKCYLKPIIMARKREKRQNEPSNLLSTESDTDQESQDASRTSIAMPIFMMNILGMKKLRITKQISKGGFGYVYLGVYDGKRVAVKQLIKPKNKFDKLRLSGMFGMF